MLRPNTHSRSQKFRTERTMSNSARTSLPASDLESFEFFLDSSGLDKVRIGFYEKRTMWDLIENFIVYEIPDDKETQEMATVLALRHGSVELAYNEFKEEVFKKISTSIISYGY